MRCPICGKPGEQRHRPFCSPRCADIDLARWLNESYRIPDQAAGDEDPPPDGPEEGGAEAPRKPLH